MPARRYDLYYLSKMTVILDGAAWKGVCTMAYSKGFSRAGTSPPHDLVLAKGRQLSKSTDLRRGLSGVLDTLSAARRVWSSRRERLEVLGL
jgi:hypothetical protein